MVITQPNPTSSDYLDLLVLSFVLFMLIIFRPCQEIYWITCDSSCLVVQKIMYQPTISWHVNCKPLLRGSFLVTHLDKDNIVIINRPDNSSESSFRSRKNKTFTSPKELWISTLSGTSNSHIELCQWLSASEKVNNSVPSNTFW